MVTSHYKTRESRFKAFIGGLVKGDEGSFYDPIEKNKLDFFQHKQEPAPGDLKQKVERMTVTYTQSYLYHASQGSVTSSDSVTMKTNLFRPF